ncbi:MAG: retropepsin-like domain-containing protein [Thaumarchaeota archaeon]|nr:retropepsin-like domain-containing protein [Nitrososphaerota archaeon]
MNLTNPPSLFVRVEGSNGERELRAILDSGATICLIRRSDALELGYQALYEKWMPFMGEGGPAVTNGYIVDAPIVTLSEVSLGKITKKNVRTLAFELPEEGGIDFVVGTNFLKNMKVTMDFSRRTLRFDET